MSTSHFGLRLAMILAVAGTIAAAAESADAATRRSMSERAAFQRENACPITGRHRGACPGWEIDHVRPLCAGGPDRRENMQWLDVPRHREKSKADRRLCRSL